MTRQEIEQDMNVKSMRNVWGEKSMHMFYVHNLELDLFCRILGPLKTVPGLHCQTEPFRKIFWPNVHSALTIFYYEFDFPTKLLHFSFPSRI